MSCNDPVALRRDPAADAGARHRDPEGPGVRRGRLSDRRLGRDARLPAPRPAAGRRRRAASGSSSPARSPRRSRCCSATAARGLFARRIRRLEAAAERIAAGDFDEPVVDHGSDELGQLARAFERMRLRLAHARPGPRRVHRQRLARAAHAALLARRASSSCSTTRSSTSATREEFLAQMREQVARLTKLATDLLDLSRLDAGRLAVDRRPSTSPSSPSELAAEFRARAAATQHALEVAVGAPVAAEGDAERVLQIGRILVENALVHTPPGTTVRVSTAARRRPGDPDGRGRRPRHPARGAAAGLRALLPARRHRAPPAAASGSRSRASSPS